MKKHKNKKSLIPYLAKHKWSIMLYLLLYILAIAGQIVLTIFLARAIEAISGADPQYMEGVKLLLVVMTAYIVKRLGWYFADTLSFRISANIVTELNVDLSKQAFRLSSKTYSTHPSETFITRIVDDPEIVMNRLQSVIERLDSIISNLIIFIYLLFINPWVSLIFVGCVAISSIIEYFRLKNCNKKEKIITQQSDEIRTLTNEIVKSEKDIKALGLENKLGQMSKASYSPYRNATKKFRIQDYSFDTGMALFNEVVGIVTLILGIHFLDLGTLTLGSFMIIYSHRENIQWMAYEIGSISSSIIKIRISCKRMFALFDEENFMAEKFGNTHLDRVKGKIEFKNVGYTFKDYEEQEDENKKGETRLVLTGETKVFDNLSFKIKPNTTVAFVGKSGSGKSTILNLMSKMFEVDSGEVLIDGVNINELDKETLRGSISLVTQSPYIFDMSIKDNILLANESATDEEIWDALKKASLDEFVKGLTKGIDTKVGESGIKLSGGQKQRLAIARALVRDSSIIIFDESTSSLDNFAQEQVKQSIDGLKGKSTIVIVAHRLSTIKNADKIYFLDEGEIIDSGTFDELYESNEKFKAMFLAENI